MTFNKNLTINNSIPKRYLQNSTQNDGQLNDSFRTRFFLAACRGGNLAFNANAEWNKAREEALLMFPFIV